MNNSSEDANARALSALNDLRTLTEIAQKVNSAMNLEQIIDFIVRKCIKHLSVEQASITLLERSSEDAACRTMARKSEDSQAMMPLRLDLQLVGWMLINKTILVVNDPPNDSRFKRTLWEESNIKNLLVAPLFIKDRIIGSINVFNKVESNEFSEVDEGLISIIASQAAQLIDNTRLYEEEEKLKEIRKEFFKHFG